MFYLNKGQVCKLYCVNVQKKHKKLNIKYTVFLLLMFGSFLLDNVPNIIITLLQKYIKINLFSIMNVIIQNIIEIHFYVIK